MPLFAVLLLALCPAPLWAAELNADEKKYDPHIEAQTDKTGSYRIECIGIPLKTYDAFHELNHMDTQKDLPKSMKRGGWLVPDEGENQKSFSYEVIVPDDYRRDEPPGVLIFISYSDSGTFHKQFRDVAADANLIVIGANDSGNMRNSPIRQTLATHALELIHRRYAIDPKRVYLTGPSGGAGMSNQLIYFRPDVFKGAALLLGSALLYDAPGSRPNEVRRGIKRHPSKDQLRILKEQTRLYIITGDKDTALDICQVTAKGWRDAGFKYTHIEIYKGVAHKMRDLTSEHFRKALMFLDAPLVAEATKALNDAEHALQRKRFEEALAGFQQAQPYLLLSDDERHKAMADQAKKQAAELLKQYNDAVAVVDQAIEVKDARAATEALRDLQRNWRDRLGREAATAYRKQISAIKRGG